jgi:predicted enzyme related to lactoylglutathione lyase
MMITSVAFMAYPVSNVSRSREFYERVLGLKMTSSFQDSWIEYDLGDSTFAIGSGAMGRTPGAPGAMVGFEVADFDACVRMLKEQAVPFVMEAFDTPVCRMAIVADPDGNQVMIHKRRSG